MEQCKFCTRTADRTNVLFKGTLNTFICDACIKSMFLMMAHDTIRNMDFKKVPLGDYKNKNMIPYCWLK